jgi:hypothetical protein
VTVASVRTSVRTGIPRAKSRRSPSPPFWPPAPSTPYSPAVVPFLIDGSFLAAVDPEP